MLRLKCRLLLFIFCLGCCSSFVEDKPSGFLRANNVTYYSGEQHYRFYEREGTNFTCCATSPGSVMLTYTRVDQQNYSTGFERSDSVSMYLKLGAADRGAALACVVAGDYGQSHAVTLRLEEHKDTRELLTFEVNGLILPRSERRTPTEYYYEYRYYKGENVIVDLIKNDEMYTNVECAVRPKVLENIPSFADGEYKANGSKFWLILRKTKLEMYVSCTVLSVADLTAYYMTLTFTYQYPYYYNPYFRGLPMSNLLLQYSNATSNFINYGIAITEVLHLSCYSYNVCCRVQTTLNFNYNEVITPSIKHLKARPFQLQPDRKRAYITCYVKIEYGKEKTTYLRLEKRELATTPVLKNMPDSVQDTTPIVMHSEKQAVGTWLAAVASVLVLACVIAIAVFAVRCCLKRSRSSDSACASADRRETGDSDRRETGDSDRRVTGDSNRRETGDSDRRETGDSDRRETGDSDRRETDDPASSAMEHEYETIPDPVYDEPHAAATVTPPRNEPPRINPQRAPLPLPAEASQDNESRYIHYDTPYEYRIFRLGVPTELRADLFVTSRGGLRSNCHPPRRARR